MSRKCRIVELCADFAKMGLLENDSGLLLIDRNAGHAVSLYRTKNGDIVFHDSADGCTPEIDQYLRCHGITQIIQFNRATQAPYYGTCAYHALTFLNSCSSSHIEDGPTLLKSFLESMTGHREEFVVTYVQQSIYEFPNYIDLRVNSRTVNSRTVKRQPIVDPSDLENIKAAKSDFRYDDI